MAKERDIVILDGARRTPRADILIDNREPGLFERFSTTALGGLAIAATLDETPTATGTASTAPRAWPGAADSGTTFRP